MIVLDSEGKCWKHSRNYECINVSSTLFLLSALILWCKVFNFNKYRIEQLIWDILMRTISPNVNITSQFISLNSHTKKSFIRYNICNGDIAVNCRFRFDHIATSKNERNLMNNRSNEEQEQRENKKSLYNSIPNESDFRFVLIIFMHSSALFLFIYAPHAVFFSRKKTL